MGSYREKDLEAKLLESWKGADFFLFGYPPKKYEKWAGHNDTTDLILHFKEGRAEAVDLVVSYALEAFHDGLRDQLMKRAVRHVVSIPRSRAGAANIGCDAIARAFANAEKQLSFLPGALERVETIEPGHSVGGHDLETHLETINWSGPAVDLEARYCGDCERQFKTANGFGWHLEHIHGGGLLSGGVLLVDDVHTKGTTAAACRQLITQATGARPILGFFVGKTGG